MEPETLRSEGLEAIGFEARQPPTDRHVEGQQRQQGSVVAGWFGQLLGRDHRGGMAAGGETEERPRTVVAEPGPLPGVVIATRLSQRLFHDVEPAVAVGP